jgi:hypothetical protein
MLKIKIWNQSSKYWSRSTTEIKVKYEMTLNRVKLFGIPLIYKSLKSLGKL